MKKYIVGGYVRDKLLNKNPHDKDWVVVGETIESMEKAGYKRVGKSFPVFLSYANNEEHALARIEKRTGPKHTDFEFVFSPDITLNQDLQRRDFTINSLVMDEEENLVETSISSRALSDLKNKKLVMVNKEHFAEDPLRVLRCARFAAILNFDIEENTMNKCKEIVNNQELSFLSKERLYAEFDKAFENNVGGRFVEILQEMGALKYYSKYLSDLFEASPENLEFHPEGNSGGHVVHALNWAEKNIDKFALSLDEKKMIYWAVLLHDIGKSLTDPLMFPKHHNHDSIGAKLIVDGKLNDLRIPIKYMQLCSCVCSKHMHVHKIHSMKSTTVFRFVKETLKYCYNGKLELFLVPCFADRFCNNTSDVWIEKYNAYKSIFSKVYEITKTVLLTQEEIEKIIPQNRGTYLHEKQCLKFKSWYRNFDLSALD
ncbi:MAG: hypothetical protein MJ247_06665 [Alphaproteobacteria bacterium]|nr:hypothetical protein [Alphaproteobacteria bacterium]